MKKRKKRKPCPHGLRLKKDQWCGLCILPNLTKDIGMGEQREEIYG